MLEQIEALRPPSMAAWMMYSEYWGVEVKGLPIAAIADEKEVHREMVVSWGAGRHSPANATVGVLASERNWDMVDAALEGLDDATMTRQPADHSNSIAWILWHMNHVVDTFINTRLQAKPDLWVRDGWHQKFGLDGRARIMG